MKFTARTWIVLIWLLLGGRALAATIIGERFLTDPVADRRFVETTIGTESAFTYNAATRDLTAVLDVDFDAAYYLSAPFAAMTDQNDVSFSFNFRIRALDTRVLPTAFAGLFTTNHVALGGDGLSMALSSSSNGLPAFSAAVDQGSASAGGESFLLSAGVDYLAMGRYTAGNREFAVEVFQGLGFRERVGRSVARATNALGFSVDRIGLQNSGGTAFDFTNGSITAVFDNFFVPAQPPVNISIVTNLLVTEGDAGTTDAVFVVSLSAPSVETVRVDFVTEDLSAVAGVDFLAQSGTLVFPPGTNALTIAVPVVGNRVAQPDRTFRVVLTNAANGTIVVPAGRATIRDDDVCVVSVGDAVVTEPAAGSADAVFNVSLSVSNSQVVTVRFSTAGLTATAGSDFVQTNRWIWHVNFFHVRDFPELLITGREKLFWSTWMKNETYDPSAIDETAVDEWARCSAAPGGLRAIFEVYRATFKNIDDGNRWAKTKLKMPVLTIGSQYFVGEESRRQMERVCDHVKYVELDCGHSMALERPEKLAKAMQEFFAS